MEDYTIEAEIERVKKNPNGYSRDYINSLTTDPLYFHRMQLRLAKFRQLHSKDHDAYNKVIKYHEDRISSKRV